MSFLGYPLLTGEISPKNLSLTDHVLITRPLFSVLVCGVKQQVFQHLFLEQNKNHCFQPYHGNVIDIAFKTNENQVSILTLHKPVLHASYVVY